MHKLTCYYCHSINFYSPPEINFSKSWQNEIFIYHKCFICETKIVITTLPEEYFWITAIVNEIKSVSQAMFLLNRICNSGKDKKLLTGIARLGGVKAILAFLNAEDGNN